MRCKCTAAKDRDCLDACVDRGLLDLGDSNRIIVNQDASSQPRVPERKTSRSQALPGLPTTRAQLQERAACHDKPTSNRHKCRTRSCGGGHTRVRHQTNTTTTLRLATRDDTHTCGNVANLFAARRRFCSSNSVCPLHNLSAESPPFLFTRRCGDHCFEECDRCLVCRLSNLRSASSLCRWRTT